MTPRGSEVEPEVYWRNARSSGRRGGGFQELARSGGASNSGTIQGTSPAIPAARSSAANRERIAAVVRTARGVASAKIDRSRSDPREERGG